MANIEEQIRKAAEEGKFSDLPGKGKPLRLEMNAYEDPDWRMANHILQTSGYALPWIVLQREIDAEWDAARQVLARAWRWRLDNFEKDKTAAMVDMEWNRALSAFEEQVALINRKVQNYNLIVKLVQLQRPLFNIQAEMDRICSRQDG